MKMAQQIVEHLCHAISIKDMAGPSYKCGTCDVKRRCCAGDLSSPKEKKYTLDYYMKMAEQIVEHGCHAIGIKDMAGLLKPRAASQLVSVLHKRFPDVVIHVHTHDSAGTAVATQLAAAHAGADIIDLCMDAMSGCTSQGSLGAVVASLEGTELDTGLNLNDISRMSVFWEQTRALYSPFECNLRSSSADVYYHEMPGGQYTNLKFQSLSLGARLTQACRRIAVFLLLVFWEICSKGQEQLAAAHAGSDIIDLCIDAMSGCTSQGSLGAVVASLAGAELDTGLNVDDISRMGVVWEQPRAVQPVQEQSALEQRRRVLS
jgi:pyruvate carboxylase